MARLNKAQLAEFLGYSERTLTDWQAEGLPIAVIGARGQEHEYDTASVVAWIVQRAEARARSSENPKDELYRTQSHLNRLKIAEAEGRLVDLQSVEQGFARMVVNARQRLLQIPDSLGGELAAAPSEAACADLLREAIRDALKELASQTHTGTPDQPGFAISAGAPTDRSPMYTVAG